MARYAIIKNGIVINLVESEPDFATNNGWIECPTHHNDNITPVNIGDSFIDGNFTPKIVSSEEQWNKIRVLRNSKLNESDINLLSDRWFSMNAETQQAWTIYRQKLRDIPSTYSNPKDVVWPLLPGQTYEDLIL
jgi:hypothetical protein